MSRIRAALIFSFIAGMLAVPANFQASAAETSAAATLDKLCPEWSAPDAAADKKNIKCRLDVADFGMAAAPSSPARELKVVAYNLERGHFVDGQIEALKTHPEMKNADAILLSEADRGCERTGKRHVARDMAEALGMNMVYGVEFMEIPSDGDYSKVCEHGNAVLSRYPITSKSLIRFKSTDSWYEASPGNGKTYGTGRLGGRMAIAADIDAGGVSVRLYSVHFDSSATGNKSRGDEATEIAFDAKDVSGPVIIGGDMNTGMYLSDMTTGAARDFAPKNLKKRGYADAHENLPASERATMSDLGMKMALDLIFSRGATATAAGICKPEICGSLSDHRPVWAIFSLKAE